jgi:hypothetical protein
MEKTDYSVFDCGYKNVGFLYGKFSKTQNQNFTQLFIFVLSQVVYVSISAELRDWLAICFVFRDPDEHFVF